MQTLKHFSSDCEGGLILLMLMITITDRATRETLKTDKIWKLTEFIKKKSSKPLRGLDKKNGGLM